MRFVVPPKKLPYISVPGHPWRSYTVYHFANFTDPIRHSQTYLFFHTLNWFDHKKPQGNQNCYISWEAVKLFLKKFMFSRLQNNQLLDYLHSNMHYYHNEKLNAHLDQQKSLLHKHITFYYSEASVCHGLSVTAFSKQIAGIIKCHSHQLSVIKKGAKAANWFEWRRRVCSSASDVQLCFLCPSTWLLNCEEQRKNHKHTVYIPWIALVCVFVL